MRFRATITGLASASVLGLALASSCGSTPPPSNQQTVAWSAPAGGHAVMIARDHQQRRRGSIDISNSSCHHEQVVAQINLDGSTTRVRWVLNENGCLWFTRMHVHCGIPSRGIDAGWHNSGWIESFTDNNGNTLWSSVTCPNNTFAFVVWLQWHHHVNNTIIQRRLL